jgi:hypothetical protein
MSPFDLNTLRRLRRGWLKGRHTPAAWMMSLAFSLALRQIVFFVWVTLSEAGMEAEAMCADLATMDGVRGLATELKTAT